MGKLKAAFDRWGYLILCGVCAGVILFSAFWTKRLDEKEYTLKDAQSSLDETLSDVQYGDSAASVTGFCAPCEGEILLPYSASPIYLACCGVWKTHPHVSFFCGKGEPVYAMYPGTVEQASQTQVLLSHGDKESLYEGLEQAMCEVGKSVAAGDIIGYGGGQVPYEMEGSIRVSVTRDGKSIPFMEE